MTVAADDFRSDTHRLLLNVAANQATLALLTHAARDEQRISDILQRIGTSVASELDLETVVQAVTDEATALTGADFGAFFNALVGWLSMVRRPEVMTPAGLPKAWQAIDRNAQALTTLIEDLLDVSRIATGKIHLSQTDVDLNDVVRDSVRAVEPEFQEKHVTLSVETGRKHCIIVGDAARLRQIVVNLLSNAVKFTLSGGQVRVRVKCDDRAVVLTVSDTGIGIHPDFLPHVFDRFRQADSNATTGLGLGLAIVKNLIELHGGTVEATSEGIGRGTDFTVTLPRKSGSADAHMSSPAGPS